MRGPFEPGERVLLLDQRGRRFLVRLESGGTFHFHAGALAHDDLIGGEEGLAVRTSKGAVLAAYRPRMADYVVKMGRGAQVIYPKDLGAILVWADIAPAHEVLEAGTGSGSLTIALCRATGPDGLVVSYEEREEHREVAARNVERFFGKPPAWLDLRPGDVREVAATGERFDRAVLDLSDPRAVLGEVAGALRPGGILCCYLPTTPQVQGTVVAMEGAGFDQIETLEVMLRTWHVTERSVRPDHRMVGHTGFLTIGRMAMRD